MSLDAGVLLMVLGMHDRPLRERSRVLSKGVMGITFANPPMIAAFLPAQGM